MHFLESIARARLAVTGQTSPAALATPAGATTRPAERPLALTARPEPGEGVTPRVLATFQGAEEVAQGVKLSRGARRLWGLLYRLAVDVARVRAYGMTPDQVTFHCPAVTLAGVLDYHPDHLSKLGRELEAVGLLDYGGHAQQVKGRSMWDGCLWAVKTRPESGAPRIRADEWKHEWRPGFAADVEGKTGATAEMQELFQAEADEAELYRAAQARAAISGPPDTPNPHPLSSPGNLGAVGLSAVAERIPGLLGIHPRARAAAVGKLASAMCAALNEPERRRYWCRVLWEAIRATYEGRAGVQTLAAQVSRLAGDLEEGAPWRNAGAVLAARLRPA